MQKEELNSLYLLYGEEIYLLEKTVKNIKKSFGEIVSGINYITIDQDNLNTLIPNIETPAFGFEKKLIIVKSQGKLFKKTAKAKNVEADKIAEYIEENIKLINEAVILVFIEQEINKGSLTKTIEKYGKVQEFKKLTPMEATKTIKKICTQYEVNIANDVLATFIDTCGLDLQNLINEIRKLIEYVGKNGTITNKEILLLSVKEFDSVIFDLTDNLGKKNIAKAMEILKELVYNKEPIQKILITLYGHFRKLYITLLAEKQNKNIAEALNLKPNQMFLVSKYKMQAKYFKEKELKKILEELIELDYNSKQGLIDVGIGLEAILCAYCGI